MASRTETKTVEQEVTVYYCDACDARIGPAPFSNHGGYFVVCTTVSPDPGERWSVLVCSTCMGVLKNWSKGGGTLA